jgi:hypothetical protein
LPVRPPSGQLVADLERSLRLPAVLCHPSPRSIARGTLPQRPMSLPASTICLTTPTMTLRIPRSVSPRPKQPRPLGIEQPKCDIEVLERGFVMPLRGRVPMGGKAGELRGARTPCNPHYEIPTLGMRRPS